MMGGITAEVSSQNLPKGKFTSLFDQDSITLRVVENKIAETLEVSGQVGKNIIHFYFCLEGSAAFRFGPFYQREIQSHRNYFFYNPEKELNFELLLAPASRMIELSISLEGLHRLFTHETLPFLKPENVKAKFYDEREIPASLYVVLNQLFSVHLDENSQRIYYQGKAFEILSLYFSEKKPDTENCPFLNDQVVVRKIKNAKDILLKNAESPPGLKELAKMAGLNEYQLKVGFKEIYGNTVYGYLLDHKLENARALLDAQHLQVSEVAFRIGYANTSHFIAAFKKKFGVTPKKYLMGKR
jgi:AraC-like DNA-binding protein